MCLREDVLVIGVGPVAFPYMLKRLKEDIKDTWPFFVCFTQQHGPNRQTSLNSSLRISLLFEDFFL